MRSQPTIMRAATVVFLASLAAGCVTNPSDEHEDLTSMPTPAYWSTETPWAFTLLDSDGQIETVFIMQFTDYPAETCSGGEPKQVDILHESPPPPFRSAREIAYLLYGRALFIALAADLCGVHNDLQGELTENGFVGTRIVNDTFEFIEIGKVYGVPIPPIQ